MKEYYVISKQDEFRVRRQTERDNELYMLVVTELGGLDSYCNQSRAGLRIKIKSLQQK